MAWRLRVLLAVVVVLAPAAVRAQAAVEYRLSFPEAEHRLMSVEVIFADVPAGTLELRMSRSSPGRYALHEFAKNVLDVQVADAAGSALPVARPNPHQWNVTGHHGTVRVSYRVFGDRVDGTYLAIDTTHAHINMPAALMWARGFELRPALVRFTPPPGSGWRVGTQLLPGADPFTFTAPNLQYLMDSPTEVSAFSLRSFTLADAPGEPVVRLAVHHAGTDAGTDAELDAFTRDVERIVHEAGRVYGEFPAYEGNTYTFIADYTPWANGDGMEHRNSTIVTSSSSIRSNRYGLLDTISHEFFHSWNVERIRPRALEPFNFEDANMSGELWLAEGFTSYYGPLVLLRAGLIETGDYLNEIASVINDVVSSPARRLRSAEDMSRLAPFVDAASAIDRTDFDNTYLSYYTWGAAIGLGLDLSLRDRSNGTITLDHFMQALWQRHGRPGGKAPGYVDAPYTIADVKAVLATVAGDAAFADDFFARYIQGRDVVSYESLLARAGFVLRLASPGRASVGHVHLADSGGKPRLAGPAPLDSPVYKAGLDRDDAILAVGGVNVDRLADFDAVISARKPGDDLPIVYERRGQRMTGTLRLVQDPRVEVVATESAGRSITAAQQRFREMWLSSRSRKSF
jgi:predicted metalloprotease with PDZ domain